MFRKKKNKNQSDDDEEELVDVEDDDETDSDDIDDELDDDGDIGDASDDDDNKSIRIRYSRISRMFHKHLIYVRIVALVSLTTLLAGSIAGGIVMGLKTQSAKSKQVTPYNTALQFSKTGAKLTVGQAYRSGSNVLIPLYNEGVTPINTTQKATASSGTFASVSANITLPSYSSSGSGSTGFIPISAKNYRMYVSALKGKMNPATQVKYVKFGATGIGAIVISKVPATTTVRVLLENEKVYQVPGASAPGLTVNGRPVDTKRDVVLVNTNLGTTKTSERKFSIGSSGSTLLKVAYADDYMKLWRSDQSVLTKLQKIDKQKLLELQSNKASLNASADASSANASSGQQVQSDSQNAIIAQQTIVDADSNSEKSLKASKATLNDYVDRVSGQMTQSTNAQIVR